MILFLSALQGYFPEVSEAKLSVISHKLWRFFIPHFFLLKRHKANITTQQWSNERRRSYKMEHDFFYILVITLIFPIFVTSPLGKQYHAHLLSNESLLNKAARYLGDRYAYFQYCINT